MEELKINVRDGGSVRVVSVSPNILVEKFRKKLGMLPEDKILMNEHPLTELNLPLSSYFSTTDTLPLEMVICRFTSDPVFVYQCDNCGMDVELKKSDAIRCRNCGCCVISKKRTQMKSMYYAI
jgi:DNA-directed RNA polymerase subunit RPC12/RpoP